MVSYEEIVRQWYVRLRPRFLDTLLERYRNSDLRLEDAENIYQDVFLAIHQNLIDGKIRENTAWSSYILRIGLNMASKRSRDGIKTGVIDETGNDDNLTAMKLKKKIDDLLLSYFNEDSLYKDPDAQEILASELTRTPEPCASLIKMKYLQGLKDQDIVEELETYNSTQAIKSKRSQCMKDLVYRVKRELYLAGIINTKPERR